MIESQWVGFKLNGFDPFTQSEGYELDVDKGGRAIRFIETMLHHARGKKKSEPFLLEPWQKAFYGHLYGWKDKKGNRRFTEVLLHIPRKNGKSLMASAIAWYELFCGDPNSPEITLCARDRENGRLLFDTCKIQASMEEEIFKRIKLLKNRIQYDAVHGVYTVISHESDRYHGGNCSCVIADEG